MNVEESSNLRVRNLAMIVEEAADDNDNNNIFKSRGS